MKKKGRPVVAIIMGSLSDWATMKAAADVLGAYGVPHETQVVSAHRTPDKLFRYAETAEERGLKVIIAGAGGAAHLPGMTAAKTTLPVLGVPVESRALKGLDSLLSIAQMPRGVAVGALAVGEAGAANAGHLAAQILALSDPALARKIKAFRAKQTRAVLRAAVSEGALAAGRTLGILGGGQLGRLIAEAARGLGYRTAALDASPRAPALQVVDVPVVGAVDDAAAALRLAQASDLLTLEWELIPAPVLEAAAKARPLYPAPSVLAVIQDRLAQKDFLAKRGFPQTPYGPATSASGFSLPVVLKRRRHGYDGKGQCVIERAEDAAKAEPLLTAPCVWEKKVFFERELSVILARGRRGETAVYPLAENRHEGGILRATRAPARVPPAVAARAVALARELAEALGHVGVMAVELFQLPGGELLVNEIAPRVHNSGHFTLGACPCSQFEQHVRAVCGLPLGPVEPRGPAAMVNLLGELWRGGEPNWAPLRAVPGLTLHLYGKDEAKPGRKMGHYTVVGEAAEAEFEHAAARLASLVR